MITKDNTIGEVIRLNENSEIILMRFGMGCIGCPNLINIISLFSFNLITSPIVLSLVIITYLLLLNIFFF